eukprot:6189860-Pleurochrysis_carterae.AAC.2
MLHQPHPRSVPRGPSCPRSRHRFSDLRIGSRAHSLLPHIVCRFVCVAHNVGGSEVSDARPSSFATSGDPTPP